MPRTPEYEGNIPAPKETEGEGLLYIRICRLFLELVILGWLARIGGEMGEGVTRGIEGEVLVKNQKCKSE